MKSKVVSYWAIVPAAGIGRRMGSSLPKQYLPLFGRTVIEHSISRLLNQNAIRKVLVAVGADDDHWPRLSLSQHENIETVPGGEERYHSVQNALTALEGRAQADDWILVHDAVRPCVADSCLRRLMTSLADHPVGGLLGHPLADTVKKVDADAMVEETVDRSRLWAAATPQMFRYGVLQKALGQGRAVTDEAMAVEALGLRPQMVAGRRDNLKITVPGDLELASLILQAQQSEEQS